MMVCGHPACRCTSDVGIERNGRNYCSEHCAQQEGDDPLAPCPCGHAGCSAAAGGAAG
ncbi:MAG: metallothionein [Acidobacteria bacterium]|nr:MAG: metallothionein [Acidobacteriota bacterium]